MDEKFAENLGMSSNVDEGLWDRLKGRAASFKQGAQNFAKIGDVGTTEATKFNSLFRSFVNTQLSVIKSFDSAITPWAKHVTPEEAKEIAQIESLEQALKRIDFGKMPVTEALPSFSNLGARWAGGVQNLIDSYKKRIASTYDSFINDVKKMNIVPDQYIQRKIASSNSGAYEALKALEPIIGKPTTSGVPTPTSAAPAPTATAPAPEPAAPAPTATATAPEPATPEPATPAASGPTAPAPTPSTDTDSAPDPTTADYILHTKALEEIGKELKSGTLSGEIAKNIAKMATKSEKILEPPKPISVTYGGKTYVLVVRYKYNKDNYQHTFEGEIQTLSKNPSTGNWQLEAEDKQWHPILAFRSIDVMDMDGNPLPSFDVFQNIQKTNPELGQTMQKIGKPSNYSALNTTIRDGLTNLMLSTSPDTIRGIRAKDAAFSSEKNKNSDQERTGPISPDAPTEKPVSGDEKLRNPYPDKRGRTTQPPKDKEAPKASEPTELPPLTPAAAEVRPPEPPKSPTATSPKTSPKSAEKPAEPAPPTPPTPAATSPEKPDSSNLGDLVPPSAKPKAKPAKTPKSGINVDGEGNLTLPGSTTPESPLNILKSSLKKNTITKRDVDDFVGELKTFNATTDQIKRVMQRIIKDIGAEKKTTATATPQAAEKSAERAARKPEAKAAANAAKATPPAKGAVAPPKPAAAPEKKAAVAPVKTEPVAPEAPAPTGKSMFGSDAERLKRVNDRWMVPNKLAPLTTVDQMQKFRSALGSDENPPSYKIQAAHQQATGATPPPQSGAEKLKARVAPKTKVAEFKEYFL